MLKNPVKALYGTALEGWENSNYQYLVDTYDQHTADKLIEAPLRKAGVTLEEFHSYRSVRHKMHQGQIRLGASIEEAERIARGGKPKK